MAQNVKLESGWLSRQVDTASQRARELPQWLTRSNEDANRSVTANSRQQNSENAERSES